MTLVRNVDTLKKRKMKRSARRAMSNTHAEGTIVKYVYSFSNNEQTDTEIKTRKSEIKFE